MQWIVNILNVLYYSQQIATAIPYISCMSDKPLSDVAAYMYISLIYYKHGRQIEIAERAEQIRAQNGY
jgi:hypothetical protein